MLCWCRFGLDFVGGFIAFACRGLAGCVVVDLLGLIWFLICFV